MRRRGFLKSVVGVVPIAMLGHFGVAADGTSANAHVLKIGEDVAGTPLHRGYSTMAYKVSSEVTDGRLFVFEHTNLVKGGPPLHVHPDLEEWFHVEEGEVLFQIGDKRMTLQTGDSILVPRQTAHAFAGLGKPSRLLIAFSPAGQMEDFFRASTKVPIAEQGAAFHEKFGIKLVGEPLKV